jgi:hypothetical protein
MTIRRLKSAVIIILFFVDVLVFYVGYQVGASQARQETIQQQVECGHLEIENERGQE